MEVSTRFLIVGLIVSVSMLQTWSMGATVDGNPSAAVDKLDFAPRDGVIQGCKPIEADNAIVHIGCPWSADGSFRSSTYRLFTASAVADQEKRLLFNKVLNSFFTSSYGICDNCSFEEFQKAAEGFRRKLPDDTKRDFLDLIFRTRDASVWSDGYAGEAYAILLSEFDRPYGLELVSRAVTALLREGRAKDIDSDWLVELIVYRPEIARGTFEALVREKEEWPRLQLLGALGLARLGEIHDAEAVAIRVERDGKHIGDAWVVSRARESNSLIHNLPKRASDLHKRLSEWLEEPGRE